MLDRADRRLSHRRRQVRLPLHLALFFGSDAVGRGRTPALSRRQKPLEPDRIPFRCSVTRPCRTGFRHSRARTESLGLERVSRCNGT